MNWASVCSGIDAPAVAWGPLGWRQEFSAEIEPFPCAVLQHHHPEVPNHGNLLNYEKWPLARLHVLIGGTPCQSFSVAGLRKGMADPRGNLALTFLDCVERFAPAWFVWENVPGVLSSDGGRSFGSFLGGVAKIGYGFAYAVLDAQWFGVAQRRERVFVVGHIGGEWQRCAAVLFDRESLCGHPAPGREKGQGTACDFAPCLGASGLGFELTGDTRGQDCVIPMSIGFDSKQGGDTLLGATHELMPPIKGRARHAVAHGIPEIAWALQERDSKGSDSSTKDGHLIPVKSIAFENKMAVRRLLPVECERLMGFPDAYTLIDYRGKPACDGPRYKALGNSQAVPVIKWIGQQIEKVHKI